MCLSVTLMDLKEQTFCSHQVQDAALEQHKKKEQADLEDTELNFT